MKTCKAAAHFETGICLVDPPRPSSTRNVAMAAVCETTAEAIESLKQHGFAVFALDITSSEMSELQSLMYCQASESAVHGNRGPGRTCVNSPQNA